MQSEDIKTQSRKPEISKVKQMSLLGEEFSEKSEMLREYYDAVIDRCDIIEQVIIHALREHIENYERCVSEIYKRGFTVDDCLKAYEKDCEKASA